MDINSYLKNNFDDIINNIVAENLKTANEQKIKQKSKLDLIQTDEDSDECYSDDDAFYSKDEIYGSINEYDDEYDYENNEDLKIRNDDYNSLHVYLKNEKYPGLKKKNEDYNEENEISKDIMEEEYEEMCKKTVEKFENDKKNKNIDNNENTDKTTEENDPDYEECAKIILDKIKDNKKEDKEESSEEQVYTKKNKITIGNVPKDYSHEYGVFKNLEEKAQNNGEGIDHGEYIFNVINLYMKYYNKKYQQNTNFFAEIEDKDKDTNRQMELFIGAVDEYQYIREVIFKNKKNEFYFEDRDKVKEYMDNEQIESFYVLEIKENENNMKSIYSPSLLDCLNYLRLNDITEDSWNIYNYK